MGDLNDRILAEVGARSFLERLGLDLSPLGRASQGNIRCPVHHERNGAALSVDLDLGRLHCFGKCLAGWDLVSFGAALQNRPDDISWWKELSGAWLQKNGHHPPPVTPRLPAVVAKPKPDAPFCSPEESAAIDDRCRRVLRLCHPTEDPLGPIYGVWRYRSKDSHGRFFEVYDGDSELLCDLKRRQESPKPPPEKKSLSLAPWCFDCSTIFRRGDAAHADHKTTHAHAGWFGFKALAAYPQHRVLLCAGEKDAYRGAPLLIPNGIVPISWSGGESGRPRSVARVLGGRAVLVLYDNDDTGKKQGPRVAEWLAEDGVAARNVEWSEVPSSRTAPGKDLSDWLDAGGDPAALAASILRIPVLLPVPAPLAESNGAHDTEELDCATPTVTAELYVSERHTMDDLNTLVFWRDDFYVWRRSAYRNLSTGAIEAELLPFLRRGRIEPKPRNVADVVRMLQIVTFLDAEAESPFWRAAPEDAPTDLIPFRNGLLDVSRDELLPPNPGFFNLNALPYDYTPERAVPKRWLEFLYSLWPDENDTIETLQEIFGYCMSTDTSQQKMFAFIGPTRGGKSVCKDILERLVGLENCCAPSLANLSMNFGNEEFIGKSLAVVPDAQLPKRGDDQAIVAFFKQVSGEDRTSIQRKRRSAWIGKLPTRILILANEIPALMDSSGALANRFIPIRFRRTFLNREDPHLRSRLYPELPAIVHWALDGRRRLLERGHFKMGAGSAELSRKIMEVSNPLLTWIETYCETGDSSYRASKAALYSAYRAWADAEGVTYKPTKVTFINRVETNVPYTFRTTLTGNLGKSVPALGGIRLNVEGELLVGSEAR